MSSPTPLQSFIGGIGLSLPVHALLVLNGKVLGISGFIHRAVLGDLEAAFAVSGLILGGTALGMVGSPNPEVIFIGSDRTVLSGFLVGAGSKLMNGCTSGHMIAGIARLSLRSIVATAIFTLTGALASRTVFGHSLQQPGPADWSLKANSKTLFTLQALPLAISALLYFLPPGNNISPAVMPDQSRQISLRRIFVSFATAFSFAISLSYTNLSQPIKTISFLLLPFHKAFDPSLVYLAVGALPLTLLLYKYGRGNEKPRLCGTWDVPKDGKIDTKLISGALLFGLGWGIGGRCPGPGLVNLGQALSMGSGVPQAITWVGSFVAGGLLARAF